MKNRSILLLITTSCLGVVSARAQSNFPNGFSIGNPVDAQCVSWDNEVGIGRTTSFGSENGGLTLYSNVKETSKAALDGGVTLFGNPLTFVPRSSPDWSGGTFDVWNGDAYAGVGGTPVFRIDTVADKATFDTLDVDITNGTLSVAGSPVMTTSNAGSVLAGQGFLQASNGGGLVLSGTHGGSAIPATGAGTRMMWYPGKSAFRTGRVTANQWDDANVGVYSTAMGYDTQAVGAFSTAMGGNTVASGWYSTAMGRDTTASGLYSTAIGYKTRAIGLYSTAMGDSTAASGQYSTTMGKSTAASGQYSTAMGYEALASGEGSTAMGITTVASAEGTTAMGIETIASAGGSTAMGNVAEAAGFSSLASGDYVGALSYAGTALGRYNEQRGDREWNSIYHWQGTDQFSVLEVGIGTSSTARKNALTILQDGSVELGKATQTDDSVPLIIKSDGSVILSKTQGDISMGIYGN